MKVDFNSPLNITFSEQLIDNLYQSQTSWDQVNKGYLRIQQIVEANDEEADASVSS